MRLYSRHIRAAKLCMKGARQWFGSHPEFDYRDFLANGIDADVIRKLDDPICDRVLAVADAEAKGVN